MLVDHWSVDDYFSVGGTGVDELRWTKPVFPGDTLSCEVEILSTSAPRSKPDIGFVNFKVDVFNQNDEMVMTMKVTNIQKRRPA
jgi:acyl dehydratase